jgi:hypothetical protein
VSHLLPEHNLFRSFDVVETVSWMTDLPAFMAAVNGLNPLGGGATEVAFTEGLMEAMHMFSMPPRCGDNRCALLTADMSARAHCWL